MQPGPRPTQEFVSRIPFFESPDILASGHYHVLSGIATQPLPIPQAHDPQETQPHRGTSCLARLRMYKHLRWLNLPLVYSLDSRPSNPASLWTDWMTATLESETWSLTVSGTIVKSCIVRAERRGDGRVIRLRVIPFFGEMYVPDLRTLRGSILPGVPYTPSEYYQRGLDSNTVWVGILTSVVSKHTDDRTSSYIWYRVALELNDRVRKKRSLAAVHRGPYDVPEHRCYLRITVDDDVRLLPGYGSMAVRPTRDVPTVCCELPVRGVHRATAAAIEWVHYRW
ncbi:uncharacterized protein B0H18DRAFT_1039462 [Fomitopsis serialis]|uniref:uncharacterized protein n=1 Tax=Fomitopsis serialis TaxID=139415 RepID=UPI0020089A17|nr:uncharacterized protein B0H18DRAFT_1039462 [Neoantrodia serialis]KAH9916051.1 hypothetical protein B0H18DRAFT_1039462 [Neoantrodia serialis]